MRRLADEGRRKHVATQRHVIELLVDGTRLRRFTQECQPKIVGGFFGLAAEGLNLRRAREGPYQTYLQIYEGSVRRVTSDIRIPHGESFDGEVDDIPCQNEIGAESLAKFTALICRQGSCHIGLGCNRVERHDDQTQGLLQGRCQLLWETTTKVPGARKVAVIFERKDDDTVATLNRV